MGFAECSLQPLDGFRIREVSRVLMDVWGYHSDEAGYKIESNMDVKEPLLTSELLGMNSVSASAPIAAQWISTRRQNIRPWSTFLNTNHFQVPLSPALATQRLVRNIDHFQSNYFFVFIGLAIFCLVTSPFLLLALASFLGACYLVRLKNAEGPVRICDYELNMAQQYTAVAICSIPVFLFAGASSAIFWLIGLNF
uniref:PRA1 family protein n=1 Tax=Strigamia maritima TaxID=126957 RepID=T1JID3_STRMM